jgi:hypothetical protein
MQDNTPNSYTVPLPREPSSRSRLRADPSDRPPREYFVVVDRKLTAMRVQQA